MKGVPPDMSFCINCGARLPDGAAFCINCGARVAAVPAAPVFTAPEAPAVEAPVFTAPEAPAAEAPAYTAPEAPAVEAPIFTKPARAYTAPEPEPAPAYAAPAPEPAPAYTAPAYTAPTREPVYAQQPAAAPAAQQAPVYAPVYQQNNYYAAPAAPAYQAKTNRSLTKYFWLSLITLGIYSIVFYSKLSTDCNVIMSRYDGKKTMHYCLVYFIFSWLTLGIVPLVWGSKISSRIGREVQRRGIDYGFGAGTFWGWNIFGALILVGPFIYMHKLCKAMNYVCADYNYRG